MKRLITTIAFLLLGVFVYAQVGLIENIVVLQRTDGTGVVDINYDLVNTLDAEYDITIEVSFDAGETYSEVSFDFLSGDLESVTAGTNLHIVWDGLASHPNMYTEEAKIKIIANIIEGDDPNTVTDIDGNVYPIIFIGDQIWMGENLRTTKDAAGNTITRNCYNNDVANCNIYGGLYEWTTIMNGAASSVANPSGVQGICPDGWHVPSEAEWAQLISFIGGTNIANKLKSCRQVNSPLGGECTTSEHPRWNSHGTHHGTDDFNFSALPNGIYLGGASYEVGAQGSWWTATEYSGSSARYRAMSNSNGNAQSLYDSKTFGLGLRCVKNQ